MTISPCRVSRVAVGLGVSWHTANNAVISDGKRRLIDDPARFDGVTRIGVDEQVRRHPRFVDMAPGRSKVVFKEWLAGGPKAWQRGSR